jgi:hypothetical protein
MDVAHDPLGDRSSRYWAIVCWTMERSPSSNAFVQTVSLGYHQAHKSDVVVRCSWRAVLVGRCGGGQRSRNEPE